MHDERLGAALVLVSAAGFGTLGVLGKVATAAGLSIPTVLAARFSLATVLVWPALALSGDLRPLRGRNLAAAVALGAGGYATMSGLYFWGLSFMTAGLVALVLYTYPVFVALMAAAALDEPATSRRVAAVGLAVAGVALVAGADPAGADPRGVAVVLGAAVVYAGYITASRATLGSVEPGVLTAHVVPAAAASFLAVGTATGRLTLPTLPAAWAVLVAIAVVATAVPILAFFAGLSRVGAGRASVLSTFEPVVTVALGAAALGEPVTATTVVGGGLVLAGVVVLERR